jgi:hypothetical protein
MPCRTPTRAESGSFDTADQTVSSDDPEMESLSFLAPSRKCASVPREGKLGRLRAIHERTAPLWTLSALCAINKKGGGGDPLC